MLNRTLLVSGILLTVPLVGITTANSVNVIVVPEWHSLKIGDVVGHGAPATNADGTVTCNFGEGQASIAFLPEEQAAFAAAGMHDVTRTIKLGVAPNDPCALIVEDMTQTVGASFSLPELSIPGLSDTGTTLAPGSEVSASSTCRNLESVITYRPVYGGPDYLTETEVKANYCYDPGFISMSQYSWWCKANGWHAFVLDSCTDGQITWSGTNIRATKRGDYHQEPFNSFDHYSQAQSYAQEDGFAQCYFWWGGSTPRDQPELACRYV